MFSLTLSLCNFYFIDKVTWDTPQEYQQQQQKLQAQPTEPKANVLDTKQITTTEQTEPKLSETQNDTTKESTQSETVGGKREAETEELQLTAKRPKVEPDMSYPYRTTGNKKNSETNLTLIYTNGRSSSP